MIFERVRGIVRRAEQLHIRFFDDLPHAHIVRRKLLIGKIPNLLTGIRREDSVIAEVPLQLQVRPMIQRISDERRKHRRKSLEFFIIGGISRDHALGKPEAPHGTPFIMVAAEPDFGDVLIFPVFRNLLRIHVAVIVDNRHFRRIVVIKNLRNIAVQQKILVHKRLHFYVFLSSSIIFQHFSEKSAHHIPQHGAFRYFKTNYIPKALQMQQNIV